MEIPAGGANGVIICQGGQFGGWALHFNKGKPVYTYNFLGLGQTAINSSEVVAPGKATIKVEFAYDGGDVLIRRLRRGKRSKPTRGEGIVAHLRAHPGTGKMTTEEILALMREE